MDLLQGVKDAVEKNDDVESEIPPIDGDAGESLEKLLKVMKKLNLSDVNEEQLRETLMQKAKMGMLGGFKPDVLQNLDKTEDNASYNILLLFIFVLLIAMVFVFFGYKLYKSHTDRERKREEKRRLKQQKKKK